MDYLIWTLNARSANRGMLLDTFFLTYHLLTPWRKKRAEISALFERDESKTLNDRQKYREQMMNRVREDVRLLLISAEPSDFQCNSTFQISTISSNLEIFHSPSGDIESISLSNIHSAPHLYNFIAFSLSKKENTVAFRRKLVMRLVSSQALSLFSRSKTWGSNLM